MCDNETNRLNEDTNKMIIVGNVSPSTNNKIHQRNWIYDENGICPCLTATDFKDPKRILIYNGRIVV